MDNNNCCTYLLFDVLNDVPAAAKAQQWPVPSPTSLSYTLPAAQPTHTTPVLRPTKQDRRKAFVNATFPALYN